MPDAEAKPADAKPDKVETQHTITVGGRALAYTATAGRLALRDDDGKERAKLYYTAYLRDDVADVSTRPILFAFNGGPGSSSVWLHLGAWGPRRVVLGPDGEQPAPPPKLIDNEQTLLDVADLVFIDPVGTGYSKAAEGVEPKEFWSVEGDLDSVGDFIARFVTEHRRWASPVFVGGESYGTLRSAGLSQVLQEKHGLYLSGVVLVSVVLNMATIRFAPGNDLPYVLFLPSYCATAWYHQALSPELQARPLRNLLDEVERFAHDEYAPALMWGDRLPRERFEAIRDRVAAFCGLSPEYVEASRLRIGMGRFNKELLRGRGRTVGRLDSRYIGIDREQVRDSYEYDPSHTAIHGAFAGALNQYLRAELNYEADVRYQIMAGLYMSWSYDKWANQFCDVSEPLREAMTHNANLRVFCANGYYDLATPYFATEYTFDHLARDESLRDHVQMAYYEAGHMMYVKQTELEKMAADIRGFIAGS
ncbi:MAG: peptidase S10 [Armatimonadetes bacterium]|nr:peptidase S10 [Armatimonadota bacterium]